MGLLDYLASHPAALYAYTPLVDGNILDAFSCGDRRTIQQFFLKEYRNTKAIYLRLGDPNAAATYGLSAMSLLDYTTIHDISIALLVSYIAELLLARGQIDPLLESLLSISEDHAARAPCSDRLRMKVLSSIYLFRSIADKALGNTCEAYRLLLELDRSNWVRRRGDRGMLLPIHRQRVMMLQSFEQHIDILDDARRIRTEAPLEYYRTLKRVFEYAINHGYERSVKMMMPFVLTAYSDVRRDEPLISKVSMLKNLGQANALLSNVGLARLQLESALLMAKNRGLKGQVAQIDRIMEAVETGSVIGSLLTFRVD